MRVIWVDGRQRHEVRGLNIKCGPWRRFALKGRSASQMPQETIQGRARAVTAEEEDPRGGDAEENRVKYRYRLLLHVFALRACRLVRAGG